MGREIEMANKSVEYELKIMKRQTALIFVIYFICLSSLILSVFIILRAVEWNLFVQNFGWTFVYNEEIKTRNEFEKL